MVKTNLERFIELYKSFGIGVVAKPAPFGDIPKEEGYFVELNGWDSIYSDQGSAKLSGGYCGFYSTVHFNKDGSFRDQGFWG